MKKILFIMFGLILIIYGLAWGTRYKTGLAKPMANGRYFYYGKNPEHWSDKILYASFIPIYKTRYFFQALMDEGHWDVHWSDRKEIVLPTL
jgi:hypothetical protein